MRRYVAIVLLITLVLAVQAVATHYEGDGQETWGVQGAGSSADLNPGGDPNMQDLKGYPFGHPFIGADGTTIWPGLGSLVGPTVTPEVPSGTVKLYIARSGSDIAITWDTGLYPNVDLYSLQNEVMDEGEEVGIYSNDTGWSLLAEGQTGGEYIDAGQTGADGDVERYYKGLVAGRPPEGAHPDGGTYISQALAVGKVNVNLVPEWNLVGIPFDVPENFDMEGNNLGNLNDVLGTDIFEDQDEVWVYENSVYQKGWRKTYFEVVNEEGNWPTNISLIVGKGLWLYLSSAHVLTLVGPVFRGDFQWEIATGWNLLGDPYPLAFRSDSDVSGLNDPVEGDEIWWYPGKWVKTISLGGGPESWDKTGRTINPGDGFWYYAIESEPDPWQMTLP